MPLDNDLMVKKHASDFCATINARSLTDYKIWNKNWSDLAKTQTRCIADCWRLVDQVSDGTPEKKAAELRERL